MPNKMMYYDKSKDKLIIIAVELLDILLDKEISSSSS